MNLFTPLYVSHLSSQFALCYLGVFTVGSLYRPPKLYHLLSSSNPLFFSFSHITDLKVFSGAEAGNPNTTSSFSIFSPNHTTMTRKNTTSSTPEPLVSPTGSSPHLLTRLNSLSSGKNLQGALHIQVWRPGHHPLFPLFLLLIHHQKLPHLLSFFRSNLSQVKGWTTLFFPFRLSKHTTDNALGYAEQP